MKWTSSIDRTDQVTGDKLNLYIIQDRKNPSWFRWEIEKDGKIVKTIDCRDYCHSRDGNNSLMLILYNEKYERLGYLTEITTIDYGGVRNG